MKQNRLWLLLMLSLMMMSFLMPSMSTVQTDPEENQAALIHKVRKLTGENIFLKDRLANSKEDSIDVELKYEIRIKDLTRTVTYLEDALPKWYEKSQFVVPVAVLITIWAGLRMVSISI